MLCEYNEIYNEQHLDVRARKFSMDLSYMALYMSQGHTPLSKRGLEPSLLQQDIAIGEASD